MSWKRIPRVLCVCALLAAWAGTGCSSPGTQDGPATTLPPSTVVERVGLGTLADLCRAAQGKVLVVNLWATWCPACVAEMPHLTAFYSEYHENGVVFLALSLDDPARIDRDVRPFQKAKKLPFPIRVLEDRDLDALGKVFKTQFGGTIPVTLVYDRKGQLRRSWEEPITQNDLRKTVAPLL